MPLIVLAAILAAAPFAFAQTAVEVDAAASIDAGVTLPPSVKPLDLIKARALQIKKDARINLGVEGRPAGTANPGERAASTTPFAAQIKAMVRVHAGLIKQRFQLALRHFDNLLARIESRIDKLKAEGVATASVEAELSLAETANATAKADVQAVADFINSVDDSDDRATVRAELTAKVQQAQTSIRKAHQAIMKVVRALVKAAVGAKLPTTNATTSAELDVE
jgi:hypothetical protein